MRRSRCLRFRLGAQAILAALAAFTMAAGGCSASPKADPEALRRMTAALRPQIESLRDQQRFVEALAMAERVCAAMEEAGDTQSPAYGEDLYALGALHREVGHPEKARTRLEKALAAREKGLGPDRPETISVKRELGDLYALLGDPGQGEALLVAAAHASEGPESPPAAALERLDARISLARFHLATDRPEEAARAFQEAQGALESLRSSGSPVVQSERMAEVLSRCADLAMTMAQPELAKQLGSEAFACLQTHLEESDPRLFEARFELAALLTRARAFNAAEALYIEALDFAADAAVRAQLTNDLGTLYLATANIGKAEERYQQALDILRQAGQQTSRAYAEDLIDLALLHSKMGRYAAAEPLYREAFVLLRETPGPDHPDYAMHLNERACMLIAMGAYDEAAPLLQEAKTILARTLGTDHLEYANTLHNLGALSFERLQFKKAQPFLEQAFAIKKRLLSPEDADYSSSREALGVVYSKLREFDKAEPLLVESLESVKRRVGDTHEEYATALNNLAVFYMKQGKYARAEELQLQSLELEARLWGEDHPRTLGCRRNLISLLAHSGRRQEAIDRAYESVGFARQYLGQALVGMTDQRKQGIVTSREMDDIANDAFTLAMTDASGAMLAEGIASADPAARLGLTTALGLKGIALEVMVAEKAWGERSASPEWRENYEHLSALRREWAALNYAQAAEAGRLDPAATESLRAGIEQAERDLAQQNLRFATDLRLRDAGADEVGQALPPGTLLLEIVRTLLFDFNRAGHVTPARYLCFALRAGGEKAVAVDLGDAGALDALVAEYRKLEEEQATAGAYDAGGEAALASLGQRLYQRLLRPVLDGEVAGGCERLIIAPDGALQLIPFEALVTSAEEAGALRYLAEDYAVSYVNSGREIVTWGQAQSGEATAPLVIGDPDFDASAEQVLDTVARAFSGEPALLPAVPSASPGAEAPLTFAGAIEESEAAWHWSRLTGAGDYCSQVAEILGTDRLFVGGQAVEEVIKTCRSPRILTIATHGFFLTEGEGGTLANPLLRSGLVFAGANAPADLAAAGIAAGLSLNDGILTALEASALDLSGTELVSLTACETGIGAVQKGVGVAGLRRALRHAGAQTMLVSLWKIPVEPSTEMTRDFYEAWRKEGKPKGAAHRTASLRQLEKARATYGSGHPIFWAGVILIGDAS